jgi:hypothetical protein
MVWEVSVQKRSFRVLHVAAGLVLILLLAVSCEAPHRKLDFTTLPTAVEPQLDEQEYLRFAWDTFLYLNTPAEDGNGVIWETYKEVYDIFLPQGRALGPWGAPDLRPDCGQYPAGETQRVIRQISKSSGDVDYFDILDERMQAVGGILIDQNGFLARYEVRINEKMFDYIVANKLDNGKQQATFGKQVVWPAGTMELKASWRQLTAEEQKESSFDKKYYVTEALLYDDPDTPDNWKIGRFHDSPCKVAKVALVGLHIAYKIESNPLFVWMTFEHVDNVNPSHGRRLASFNDSSCPTNCQAPSTGKVYQTGDACFSCVENCRESFQYCEAATKTQVVRELSIPQAVKDINREMHAWLGGGGSVWANYELVGIQHPQSILTFDPTTGERLLGNSTMETYNQSYSSCIGCHYFARTKNPLNSSDFSWFLRRAKNPSGFDPSLQEILDHHVPIDAKTRDATPAPREVFRMVKGYESWGTWPADEWNNFQQALQHDDEKGLPIPGENPHGNFIRIFVNEKGLAGVQTKSFPVGSIILKENLPCRYTIPHETDTKEKCTIFSDSIYQIPVEWTIMLKMQAGYYPEGGDWYYLKGRPEDKQNPQIVDVAGKVEACASCHAPTNSGNFMFTYNFGDRPEIRSRCVGPIGPGKISGCSVD